jgi:hypothetical protein
MSGLAEADGVDAVARADARPVQAVVQALFAALAVDDEKLAFSMIAPRVQKDAGSAAAFMVFVRENFPAVYRPAYVVYLTAHETPEAVQQPVHITDEHGHWWIAVFYLQRFDKRWLVAGCDLVPTDMLTKRRGADGQPPLWVVFGADVSASPSSVPRLGARRRPPAAPILRRPSPMGGKGGDGTRSCRRLGRR